MIVFGISCSLTTTWVKMNAWETDGVLGSYVYLPDVMGYGWSLALILFSMAAWYVIVTWNEDSNKLILPM